MSDVVGAHENEEISIQRKSDEARTVDQAKVAKENNHKSKEKEETGDQEYVVENTKSCTNLFEVNVKHEEASDFEETTEQKEVIWKQFVLCTNVFLHFSCVFMLQEGECGESYVLVSWTTKNHPGLYSKLKINGCG